MHPGSHLRVEARLDALLSKAMKLWAGGNTGEGGNTKLTIILSFVSYSLRKRGEIRQSFTPTQYQDVKWSYGQEEIQT